MSKDVGFRDALVGQVVTNAESDATGLTLALGADWILVILNPFRTLGASGASDLVGEALCSFIGSVTQERLSFASGAELSVDLRDEAWVGPEAMRLCGPNHSSSSGTRVRYPPVADIGVRS
jgi:hypothetical protein